MSSLQSKWIWHRRHCSELKFEGRAESGIFWGASSPFYNRMNADDAVLDGVINAGPAWRSSRGLSTVHCFWLFELGGLFLAWHSDEWRSRQRARTMACSGEACRTEDIIITPSFFALIRRNTSQADERSKYTRGVFPSPRSSSIENFALVSSTVSRFDSILALCVHGKLARATPAAATRLPITVVSRAATAVAPDNGGRAFRRHHGALYFFTLTLTCGRRMRVQDHGRWICNGDGWRI